jgi:radical SAM superfamily enzyme YgiQ (UPF0313 family)
MKDCRVLLVAMSGVRVANESLMRTGLTLPGFVDRSRVIAALPSLGLLTLAAHTPDHWDVSYQEIDELTEEAMAAVLHGAYDLVAISCLTARIFDAYRLADEAREAGLTVVVGGLHASALPEEALEHADAVVQGEGEMLWPELLSDFEADNLQRLYTSFGRRPAFSLADARVPRYDLLDLEQYNRLTLQATRGCPRDCYFCAGSRTLSPYKRKPMDQVRRELECIHALWPHPFLELADDNTFVNLAWARELVEVLAEFGSPWFTETDISVADDDVLLERLAESNCAQLLIGLESAEPGALEGLDSYGWKQRQWEKSAERVSRIQSHGIAVNGCFVIGFDTDGPDAFERTRDFIAQSDLAEVQITLLTPFPGTALHASLRAQGRLLKPVYWDQCTLFDVTYEPARMSVSELEEGFAWLMGEVYSDEQVTTRRQKFRACRRTRRRGIPMSARLTAPAGGQVDDDD